MVARRPPGSPSLRGQALIDRGADSRPHSQGSSRRQSREFSEPQWSSSTVRGSAAVPSPYEASELQEMYDGAEMYANMEPMYRGDEETLSLPSETSLEAEMRRRREMRHRSKGCCGNRCEKFGRKIVHKARWHVPVIVFSILLSASTYSYFRYAKVDWYSVRYSVTVPAASFLCLGLIHGVSISLSIKRSIVAMCIHLFLVCVIVSTQVTAAGYFLQQYDFITTGGDHAHEVVTLSDAPRHCANIFKFNSTDLYVDGANLAQDQVRCPNSLTSEMTVCVAPIRKVGEDTGVVSAWAACVGSCGDTFDCNQYYSTSIGCLGRWHNVVSYGVRQWPHLSSYIEDAIDASGMTSAKHAPFVNVLDQMEVDSMVDVSYTAAKYTLIAGHSLAVVVLVCTCSLISGRRRHSIQ